MSVRRPFRALAAFVLSLGAALSVHAGTTDISSSPLVTAAGSEVLPNLMFVLDDSGSMDWDYMPDNVNDTHCRASGAGLSATTYSGTFNRSCCQNASNAGSGSIFRESRQLGHRHRDFRGREPAQILPELSQTAVAEI